MRGKVAQSAPAASVRVVASGDAHALIGLPKHLLLQHSGTFVVGADKAIQYSRTAAVPTGGYDEAELLAALSGSRASAA